MSSSNVFCLILLAGSINGQLIFTINIMFPASSRHDLYADKSSSVHQVIQHFSSPSIDSHFAYDINHSHDMPYWLCWIQNIYSSRASILSKKFTSTSTFLALSSVKILKSLVCDTFQAPTFIYRSTLISSLILMFTVINEGEFDHSQFIIQDGASLLQKF